MQLNSIPGFGGYSGSHFYRKNLLVMKLVLVIMITTCLQVAARSSDAQRVTISGKNLSLNQVFQEIREQTGFQFFYKNEYLSIASPVSVDLVKMPVRQALDEVFKTQPLTYAMVGETIVVRPRTGLSANDRDQAAPVFTIKGRVFDTHEPPNSLAGVIVRVKGTQRGTTTDADGDFTIEVSKGETLSFSLIGYESQEQLVLKQYKNLVVALKQKVSALNQVKVVGMNRMEQQHIASSLATLDVKSNITNKPITSLSQALQGGVTGLSVNQSSGLPGGDAASIKIRGISTLGNTNPLVLVDGVPMDMEQINPATVESVTVLKDAAAAAIYGARAANGVILITTKRGAPGRVSVYYDGYYGVQTPDVIPQFVDAPTYMEMYNVAQLNAGGQPFYTQEEIQKTRSGTDPVQYPNTDWAKQVINPAAPIMNHSLSVTGGNHLARFAITGDYLYQDGMMPVLNERRYNLRANTSITLSDKFYFYLDVVAIKRDNLYPNRTLDHAGIRILDDMYRLPPTILPKYPREDGWPTIYGRYADIVNPVAYFEQGGKISYDYAQSSVNLQPRWEVFPGFNSRGQFSFRLNSNVYHAIRNNYYFFDYYTKQLAQTWAVERTAYSTVREAYYYLSGTADYTWDKKGHHIFALGGYSQEVDHSNYWDITSIASVFGKLNYSYNDKYLLEASLRMDGSSKFGPGHKFGYFPSVALGWNISKEDFLKNSGFIKNLKLRASYGGLGNDENMKLYQYEDLISATNGEESVWGNPDITWERVDMLDIGADATLLPNNKLDLTFDYYNKLTKGIILNPPVSYVGAVGSAPQNSGRVRNRGWELSLRYHSQLGKNTSFSVRSGVSYNKNVILYLDGGPYIGAGTINKAGYGIGGYYGYKTDGLLQAGDFQKNGTPNVPIVQGEAPGDIKYRDLNGDGVIDASDQTETGNPNPRYNYFADLEFDWKNFSIETLLQGTGHSEFSANLHGNSVGYLFHPLNFSASGGVPTTYYAAHAWQPGRTNARFPRLSAQPSVDILDSDFWLWNDNYVRVKFIQLSYNIHSEFLKKRGILAAQVYLTAQNPFVFTAVPLTDPESAGGSWTYGIMKVYTIGLHLEL
jgi:TonB-linked SusC/RagA family outer membrane protein